MYQKYDENPYLLLYEAFNETLLNRNNDDYFDSDDQILELILLNNGCVINKNSTKLKIKDLLPDYYICFIKNANANEANNYFDLIEFAGSIYLVVFVDYFSNIGIEKDKSPVLDIEPDNSSLFEAIFNIVNIFIDTTSCVVGKRSLSTTASAFNNRYIPLIIAGKITKNVTGELTQEDTSLITIDELEELINEPMQLTLLGIRNH